MPPGLRCYHLPVSAHTRRSDRCGPTTGLWPSNLALAHPDIRTCVRRVIMRHGHAMIRPAPGFIFSAERTRWLEPHRGIFFSNSHLSGLSLFEEAQYCGVSAADGAMRLLSS